MKENKNVYILKIDISNDYEPYRDILCVTQDLEFAKEKLQEEIELIKIDSEMDILDAVKISADTDISKLENCWVYEENDFGFDLYKVGCYDQEHYAVNLQECVLESKKKKEVELT